MVVSQAQKELRREDTFSGEVDSTALQAFEQALTETIVGMRWLSAAADKLETEWQAQSGKQLKEAQIGKQLFFSPLAFPSETDSTKHGGAALLNGKKNKYDTTTAPQLDRPNSGTVAFKPAVTEFGHCDSTESFLASVELRPDWREVDDDVLKRYRAAFHRRNLRFSALKPVQFKRQKAFVASGTSFADSVKCVLHPSGQARICWNLFCLLLIVYDIIVIPLEAFDIKTKVVMLFMEWFNTVGWTIDIVLSFRTGYFVESRLEMEPRAIAQNYAKTWMGFDSLIVSCEWGIRIWTAVLNGVSFPKSTLALRILGCFRLFRLAKLQGLWSNLEDQLNSNVLSLCVALLKMTVVLGVALHFIACGWYFLGAGLEGGWVDYYGFTMDGHEATKLPDDFYLWYFASSRWTLAQINGRTDMDERRNMSELIYTCFVAVWFAVIFMAVFISSVTATLVELNHIQGTRIESRRLVNRYLSRHYLSTQLTGSVKRSQLHAEQLATHAAELKREEAMVLLRLPTHLARDLMYEVRGSLILGHAWFSTLKEQFPRAIHTLCHAAMYMLFLQREEVLFQTGDACDCMFFLDAGKMFYSPDNRVTVSPVVSAFTDGDSEDSFEEEEDIVDAEVVVKGDWVAESALWVEWINHGNLVAPINCNLLAINAGKFANLLKAYKGAYAWAVLYARTVVDELRVTPALTDLPGGAKRTARFTFSDRAPSIRSSMSHPVKESDRAVFFV